MNALFQCPSFFLSVAHPVSPSFTYLQNIWGIDIQSGMCVLSSGVLWVEHFTQYPQQWRYVHTNTHLILLVSLLCLYPTFNLANKSVTRVFTVLHYSFYMNEGQFDCILL